MFEAAIAAAAAAEPHANPETRAGLTLLVDGDGLAYYCAGRDDTPPGLARRNVVDKINAARAAVGAEEVRVLLTAQSSHKGYRYAVATVKPYQGQRKSGRRPKNWAYLRQLLEGGDVPATVEVATDAEADDLFGKYSRALGWASTVIHTEDKDMRMVPGTHLDWNSYRTTTVRPDTWNVRWDDVVYGRRWFWLQMLQGDGADNVPGLEGFRLHKQTGRPAFIETIKPALCGPAAAERLLPAEVFQDDQAAFGRVAALYYSRYGQEWPERLLEQAILLWMRQDVGSRPLDCLNPEYGPLRYLRDAHLERALAVINARLAKAIQ